MNSEVAVRLGGRRSEGALLAYAVEEGGEGGGGEGECSGGGFAFAEEQLGSRAGEFDAVGSVVPVGEAGFLPLDHGAKLLPLPRVGSEMTQKSGKPDGGHGEYPGRVVTLPEKQLTFTVGKFHTLVARRATGICGLLPLDHVYSSFDRRWMKSRDLMGSRDASSTLRKSVRMSWSWAAASRKAEPYGVSRCTVSNIGTRPPAYTNDELAPAKPSTSKGITLTETLGRSD
jgi:hypothetical protein